MVIIYNEKEDNGYSSSDSEENEVGNWRQEKIYYSSSYSACDITFGIKNCTNYLFTGFECENGGIVSFFFFIFILFFNFIIYIYIIIIIIIIYIYILLTNYNLFT